MTVHRTEILSLMNGLEGELRRLDLWESRPPPPRALMSEQPFCFDTLSLTQWLQWIFIARMRDLIANDAPLPTACDIHPLADHVFAGLDCDSAALLELIQRIDRLLSQAGGAESPGAASS